MRKRTVLIACDMWFGSTAYGIAKGFRDRGWDVYEINPLRYMPDYRTKLLRGVRRLIWPLAVAEYNQKIMNTVKMQPPDLFLTVKGSYIQIETLELLASLGIATVNYYPDYHFSYKGVVDKTIFPYYSHFFTTKSFQLDYLNNLLGAGRVSFLHHGYVSEVHKPSDSSSINLGSESVCDLLYIGTYDPQKEQWFVAIKKQFPALCFKIYGENWHKNAKSSLLKESIVGQGVYGSAYAITIQSAKINLAIHMGVADKTGWQDLVSTRTFEIPACKGFMLHVDNEEVRSLFEPDKEIGVFSDIESLFEQIEYYLSNEQQRLECIENAYQRCVPAYSYDARAESIIDWYMMNKKSNYC